MTSSNNKSHTQTLERSALQGIDKHLSTIAQVMIDGAPNTPAQLKATLQGHLDAAAASQTARATWQVAVTEERKARALAQATLLGLKAYLVMQYGKGAATVLSDFGFTPPKTGKPDPATTVAAIAKRKATREARHTMGPKQKKNIHGATPADPSQVPPAPSPTTSPAVSPAPTAAKAT